MSPNRADRGGMQDWSLTVTKFIEHAARWHPERELVTREDDRSVSRTNWASVREEAGRLSNALRAAGIGTGDRVATLAMNGARHLAAWYGIAGMGAVCHTLNPRQSEEQLAFIVNHAGDRLLLADRTFADLWGRLAPRCPSVEQVVFLDKDGWDTFTGPYGPDADCGVVEEHAPAGLCYTSGSTGDPKGVLYSHRSNYLHTLMVIQPDVLDLGARDVVLPVVPMFHANAWGLSFAAPAVGAKLVLPGPHLDGASLWELIEGEGVTFAAGVPTVWQSLIDYLRTHGLRPSTLRRVAVGGAACPETQLRAFAELGVEVRHAWGMTEASPVGTIATPTAATEAEPPAKRAALALKQGRPPIGVDVRIIDEAGRELSHDGARPGRLQVRGHSIVGAYFGNEHVAITPDGWFDTGDVATVDANGFMQITDRYKDVIKSGGEWISSVDMENALMSHPAVALAAVIGVPHPKWGERPLAFLKLRPGTDAPNADEVRAHLSAKFAKWELPEEIRIVDDIPLGATGKIDKKLLRQSLPLATGRLA